MQSVFSHIVTKRLSKENEDVATEALSFILQNSESARSGMLRLIRSFVPEIPDLWFLTQQAEGSIRPDMVGIDDSACIHVYLENKFWAGLTDNQPVAYLQSLSKECRPTLLLVVVPAAREGPVWSELNRRLAEAGLSVIKQEAGLAGRFAVRLENGPVMALTTWRMLLTFLNDESKDDQDALSNLSQLMGLCVAMDSEAFIPVSKEDLSDQRIPALLLQCTDIMNQASLLAYEEKILFWNRALPSANQKRIGRYASFFDDQRCGAWVGVEFSLWKKHGRTPVWVVFSPTKWGRAREVKALLLVWASHTDRLVVDGEKGSFCVAIDLPCGAEKESVQLQVVEQLKQIQKAISCLEPISDSGAASALVTGSEFEE